MYSKQFAEIRVVPIIWGNLDEDFSRDNCILNLQSRFKTLTKFEYRYNVHSDKGVLLLFRIDVGGEPAVFASAIFDGMSESDNEDFPCAINFNSIKVFDPIGLQALKGIEPMFGRGMRCVQRIANEDNLVKKVFALTKER